MRPRWAPPFQPKHCHKFNDLGRRKGPKQKLPAVRLDNAGAAFCGVGQVLVRLPAQEGRDVELVLFGLVMHRSLPAVLVETLGRSL
jgi:hypothetical protein